MPARASRCFAASSANQPDGPPDRRQYRQTERKQRRNRGPIDPHGDDAGKKIKGRKRHLLVDTEGFLLCAIVHAADIQDRDGGVLLMASLFPFLRTLYADGGYQGPVFRKALAFLGLASIRLMLRRLCNPSYSSRTDT